MKKNAKGVRAASITATIVAVALVLPGAARAQEAEARTLNELRNTVINLLQGLVDRGVLTREQAEQMVRDAQSKAEADAASLASAEQGAVRVPYVPEIVKDEIRAQVKDELRAEVAQQVVQTAQSEGWGVPAALPEWIRHMRWSGDLRVRGEDNLFARDNLPNVYYLNYERINQLGGVGSAGIEAFTNTTEDRHRLRLQFRLGFEAELGSHWTMGARLASGNLDEPISTNVTLGASGDRYQIGLDRAWLQMDLGGEATRQGFRLAGGRLNNPFFTASDLVYDRDLAFDGVAATYRLGLDSSAPAARNVYLSAGWFPVQEVELSSHDKWMLGGQLGADWRFGDITRLRAAASYYGYRNIVGQMNPPNSTLFNYTAPRHLTLGNTLFDILGNDNNGNTNLYALAADYELLNFGLALDVGVGSNYAVTLAADYVRNIGYDIAEVEARTGQVSPRRNTGYQAELAFGSAAMSRTHAWHALVGYRYLQRDAVLDAYTDSDFRLGGTDAKGYYLALDYMLSQAMRARLKYMSANEIDGAAFGVDVVQLDFTASF
jgi:polyhydroxyalkanoate synthesis regulator phasin